MSSNPPPARDVGNGNAVADEIARWRLCQVRVHCAVQAACLVFVAVDAVLDLLGRISWRRNQPTASRTGVTRQTVEVVQLALHGSRAPHLPHQL